MSGLMKLLSGGTIEKRNAETLLQTNDFSREFGLTLTHEDALALLAARVQSLRGNGRVEIGESIVERLVLAFCNSPYLSAENYVETISGLIELFYYMKNETLDRLTDDELLEKMRFYFDGSAAGSLELLAERNLETMARNIRLYNTYDAPEIEVDEEQNEDYVAGEDEKWRTVRL